MPKGQSVYICQQCGHKSSQYLRKCPQCDSWNSFVETVEKATGTRQQATVSASQIVDLAKIQKTDYKRLDTGFEEFNRVLGGGVVAGSLVLVSGDPGIGKCVTGSTRILDPVSGAFLPITDWEKTLRPVLALDNKTNLIPQPVSAFHDR